MSDHTWQVVLWIVLVILGAFVVGMAMMASSKNVDDL